MKYLLLIANAPDAWADAAKGTDDGVIEDWNAYTRALHEAGVLVYGAGLSAPSSATSVQRRAGSRLLTDGPFTETKEHLIGFYVIEVPDLDAALVWAARVPNVRTGTVEVRPISPGQTTTETLAAAGVNETAPMRSA
jgi:hypothetical protein